MSAGLSRIVVAVVLLPLVLGVVYLGGWWLFGLALIGGLIALHELFTIARQLRPIVLAGFGGLGLALVGAEVGGTTWLLAGVLGAIALSFALWGASGVRQGATAAFGVTLLGVAWVGGGLGHLLLVRALPDDGRLLIFTVLIAVFADDTAAYAVGRLIGRHRMAPAISPGKSWEGFVSGTVAAVAVAFFALYEQGVLTIPDSLALGLVIAVAATLGDLFESAVKRDLAVKDSGKMLAGHGGVLDRLDSLLWAGPAAFYAFLALS